MPIIGSAAELQPRSDPVLCPPPAPPFAHFQGGDVDAGLAELEEPAKTMIDDLLWWTEALKAARSTAS